MTHQEKLEAIRKACVEANPEIVELKFGCEFQAGTSTMFYLQTESYAVNNVGFWRAHFCSKQYPMNIWEGERQPSPTTLYTGEDFERVIKESISRSSAFSHTFPTVEIIGRPIRLADVLLATHQKQVPIPWIAVDSYGEFLGYWDKAKEPISNGLSWNLYKDSLEEQSEETVAFIYDLLK